MLSSNRKISLRQLQILIILEAFGMGVVMLPRRAAEYAARDGWLVIIGIAALACIGAALITAAMRPSSAFLEYTAKLLGRPAAKLLATGLAVKLLLNAGLQTRLFALLIRQSLLNRTPMAVVTGLTVAAAAYTASKGIETRARVAEILFILIMPLMLLLFICAFFTSDTSNLLPVFTVKPARIITGAARLGYAFTGLECLLLVFPFIQRPKDTRRAVIFAVSAAGAAFLLITLAAIASFGPDGLLTQSAPVLRMMDMLNIPGGFTERQDALMFSFWIITVFAGLNMYVFFSALLVKGLARKGKNGGWVIACATAVFALACLPLDAGAVEVYMDKLYFTFGVFYIFILPVILIAAAKLRGVNETPDTGDNAFTEQSGAAL